MAKEMQRAGLIMSVDGVEDFKKSLKDVNAALKENRAEFKKIQSQYTANTSSSEKLRNEQTFLQKQVDATNKKVELYRRQLEEMEKDENASSSAISKKRIQLHNAEASLNNYQKSLNAVTKDLKLGITELKEFGDKAEKIGKKTTAVGSTITKGITAPILGIAGASAVAWNELDNAYDNIASGTGATGKQLEKLQSTFDNVFGSMAVSSEEASSAIADINTRFGFTEKTLEQASVQFLKFAQVNKTDVSSAVALVSRAMQDANIDSKEYAKVLDALTSASQASGISVDKLAESIAKYGAPMRQLGFDMNESIALFAQWEKAGVNTEIAMSGVKKAISNFAKEGKNANVEFGKFMEEIKNAPSLADATTKAIEVFGSKAGPDLADAIYAGRFSIEEFNKVIASSSGQVEQSFEDMKDPADDMTEAMNNLKLAGAELADSVQSALAPILEKISDLCRDLAEWLKGLDEDTKTLIITIASLSAVIGPLLLFIGKIITVVGSASTMIAGLASKMSITSVASSSLGASITALSTPFVAIIATIGLVTAAVVDLWNTNEDFRKDVEDMVDSISRTVTNFWDTVLKPIIDIIKKAITDIWENSLKPLWEKFKEMVAGLTSGISDIFKSFEPIVNWVINTFGPIFVGTFEGIVRAFTSTVNWISDLCGAMFDNFSGLFQNITGILSNIINFITNIFTGNWEGAWNNIVGIFENVFGGIVNICKMPINGVIGIINGMISAVQSGINSVISVLNRVSIKIPKWVPGFGGKKFGINMSYAYLPRVPYLAKGGTLADGMAMIAEAGPELLMQKGNRTTVTPLSNGGGATKHDLIDYDKMALAMVKAMKHLNINLDDEKIGEVVDDRLRMVIA